jgi:hypothetical protein
MTFGRPTYEESRARRTAEREANMATLVSGARPLVAGTYGGSTTAPAPKGEKAKPGKRAPTKAEREWMDAITAYGCIACRMDGRGFRPAAVHHILRGGQRMGHLFTLPLCDPGHHQGGPESRHPYKARFEAIYGPELKLLERLRAEIGVLA